MLKKLLDGFALQIGVFLLGSIAVCWIAAGYLGTNPLGLAVTLLIGTGYVAGAWELLRYRRATATLEHGLAELSAPPASLDEWTATLDPSLRHAVRQRIEGQRLPLPGPTLTPYLVGLLVLLGMLGTLLGMMAMLRGTGLALETATDLQAVRDSLAAPVQGLGFAFGTSIAGVATSAMLGLLSALCRRDRLRAAQALDAKIATTLRPLSLAHRREQSYQLLQSQTELMPALIERLQDMMGAMERHSQAASERQLANQHEFHAQTRDAFAQLAASVQRSLQDSVADSVRIASEAMQPAVQTTLAAVARETAALQQAVGQAVERQLQGVSAGLDNATAQVAERWNRALEAQDRSNSRLTAELGEALERFGAGFEQRSAALLEGVGARMDGTAVEVAKAWTLALAQQQETQAALTERNQHALTAVTAAFEGQAASLLQAVDRSQVELRTALASQDEQRLTAWTESLAAMSAALCEDWARAGQEVAQRQQQICDALARSADEIGARTQAHASDTIAEISRLVDTASEAPKAAAGVIAELRENLSESMARDNGVLEERTRLMATLETLLAAVNHASSEQRGAIDALVTTSADLLDRVGGRFMAHVEGETGKLDVVAERLSLGAVEVASLGEAFGAAARVFGEANGQLAQRLQGIEDALQKSLLRSDEQLAYYVAQAREVVDLSLLAQKQIVEDLQRLPAARGQHGAAAA
ncbi:DUF802 domain-containing protein [Lysobacter silvisoli]|uniref:DUF802 domain-containing protein n=1 Tax=Lysobacter silvisoli TaxID=2293254 RepID=A0A371K1V9_9GAMM|nr:DUF802 domain-containing protein [Lysobacter silvisoli]RDZ27895.1 DUF802 domain-containing protein [Lysobacter silvisoli]